MQTLPSYLDAIWLQSKRAYGITRPPHAPLHELQGRLRTVADDPASLYGWVDIILAAVEGGLRSGATPFALAQALTNRQAELGARKLPPPLPHVPESAK